MTPSLAPLVLELFVPYRLGDLFATPFALQAYLEAQGVWPQGARNVRWRLHVTVPGWLAEMEVPVPLPAPLRDDAEE